MTPSKSDALKKSKRTRTEEAILLATQQVIAKNGLGCASIDEVMLQAGMARGTFYNYFTSREELFEATANHIRLQLRDEVEAHIPSNLPNETIIACMIHGFFAFCLHYSETGKALAHISSNRDLFNSENENHRHHIFARADDALLEILGDIPFTTGMIYIEGIVNLLIKKLLAKQAQLNDAEQVIQLTLRGLGIPLKRINAAQNKAKKFASELNFNTNQ